MDMTLVSHPVFFPTACLCGNPTGPMVDTHIEKAVVGRIYLCERCIRDLARTQGDWVERDTYETAVGSLARSEQEVARLAEELELERRPEAKVIAVESIPEFLASVTDLNKFREKKAAAAKKASAS